MLAPAIAAALVAWALLEAHAVLPVSGAPTVASPLVAAVMPSEDVHTTSNGYLLALDINVKNCSDPVHVFAQLVLPTEYYRAEDHFASSTGNPLTKSLVGLAVSDFHTAFQSIRESDWRQDPQVLHDRTWIVRFSNPVLVDATGAAEVIRLGDWRQHPHEIDAWFTADWLSPRGYGSCWLRLPSLMGPEVPFLGSHAADAVNCAIGPSADVSNRGQSSSGSGTYVFY